MQPSRQENLEIKMTRFTKYMYVWIYENEAKALISHTKRVFFFFSRETISKGDDIKIKRIVSPFFFLLAAYLAFIAVRSLFLPVFMAWKWS